MSFGEYFNAFGGLYDAYANARDKALALQYQKDAAGLYADQLEAARAAQQNDDLRMSSPSPTGGGALPNLGAVGPAGPRNRLPAFLDQSGDQGGYVSNLYRRESNFNANARPSTSGAAGLGQFIPGTWNSVASAHPELGLTPYVKGQPDPRLDEKQMNKATQALTSDNEAVLSGKGLPINDATRYSLHFLGAGAGPKFVAGALNSPDTPAIAFVGADQARANRNVFFNRDGSPKSAGQVMNDFQRSFGGRSAVASAPVAVPGVQLADAGARAPMQMPGVIENPPMPPQRPTQLAEADTGVQNDAAPPVAAPPAPPTAAPNGTPASPPIQAVLPQLQPPASPQRPMQMPAGAGGPAPAPAPPAGPGGGPVAANPANLPAPGAVPVQFQIPPGGTAPAKAEAPEMAPGTIVSPAVAPESNAAYRVLTPGARARIDDRQAAVLHRMLVNPVTMPAAAKIIQGLNAPEEYSFQMVGDNLVRTSKTGRAEIVPNILKPVDLGIHKDDSGRLLSVSPRTGEARLVAPAADKSYTAVPMDEAVAQRLVPPDFVGEVGRDPYGKPTFTSPSPSAITPQAKAAEKFAEGQADDYRKLYTELGANERLANQQKGTLNQMRAILGTPGMYVGTGGELNTAAKRALSALGVDVGPSAGAQEVFAKLSKQFVLDKAGGSLGGGFSNGDRAYIDATTANPNLSMAGNKAIIELGIRKADRDREIAQMARRYMADHGGRLDPGFDQMISDYVEAKPLTEDLPLPPGIKDRKQLLEKYGPRTEGSQSGAKTESSAPAQPAAPRYKKGDTATNPQTKQKLQFDGTSWVPVGGVL